MESESPKAKAEIVGQLEERVEGVTVCGFWRRLIALVIDMLLVSLFGSILGQMFFDYFAGLGSWALLVGFAIALLYFGVLNSTITNGRTIGKYVARIRIVAHNGDSISIPKACLRFLVLGTPFFLSGTLSSPSVSSSLVGTVVFLMVLGVGGTIGYLYIFNTRTRQSLHDLSFGTYVVSASDVGPVHALAVWRGHFAVIGIWSVAAVLFTTLVQPMLLETEVLSELGSVQKEILKLDSVQMASVVVVSRSTTAGHTTSVEVEVRFKERQEDWQDVAMETASIVLDGYPEVMDKDLLKIFVAYGYDMGLASGWRSVSVEYPPKEWRERVTVGDGPSERE